MAISNPVTIGTANAVGSATTIALTTSAAVASGGKIWICLGWFANPSDVALSSVSDGTNTYTIDVQGRNTDSSGNWNGFAIASADCPAGLASGSTITATFAAAVVDRKITGMYSTGVATGAGTIYGAVSQNQVSTATWSSTSTTVTSGDILIGGAHWEDSVSPTNTASGGNTEVHDYSPNTGSAITTCYQVGTGAAIAAQGTWTTSCAAGYGLRSSAVAYQQATLSAPTVQATAETAVSTAGTSHAINLPASIAAGDLLLICANVGSTAATFNALAGWTEVVDEGVANGITIWARQADGTEGATVTFTSSASTRSASIAYRITGAANPATQLPELSTVATGSSTAPNATTCTPTGGAKDYLWISLFGRSGEEADDDTWTSAAPAGYTNLLQKACGIAGTNLGGMIATAQRQLNAASEDAGAFTCATGGWRAYTVAVHPAPPATVLPPRATLILQAVTRSNNW